MNKTTRILIVDDEEQIRSIIRSTLKNDNTKREIFEASTALDALHLAHRISPDILLIDIDLNGHFDGFSILQALKGDRAFDGLSVVVVSGHDSPESIEQANRNGVYAYVTKPFSLNKLAELVEKIEAEIQLIG